MLIQENMIRILTVIGARPQIIKAAAISREIAQHFSDRVEERILHTGQHYDENMSGAFFRELGIPQPHYNLGVGSASHGVQTAKIIEGIEEILRSEHFDGVVLYGDTNSTVAGAIAASKMLVPIFHIEAGLRSFDMEIPEEINRCVCDQLSSLLFVPTATAERNLHAEGYDSVPMRMAGGRCRRVINSGDVMYDNSMFFAAQAEEKSDIMSRLALKNREFVLATVHRNNNTDVPERLTAIFQALYDIAEKENIKVVLPLHPRTRKMLPDQLPKELLERVSHSERLTIVPPASFYDIILLERNARVVVTDSGGVQKEAFFFGTPTVIMLPETPWVEIVEHGACICVDADYNRIIDAYDRLKKHDVNFPMLFGDGHAAEKIMNTILEYLKESILIEKCNETKE